MDRDAKFRELRSDLGADEIKHIGTKAFIKHYKDRYSPNKTNDPVVIDLLNRHIFKRPALGQAMKR